MSHWHKVLSVPIFELSYEELVRAPRETLVRLLEFCGLPWDERCLQYYNSGNAVATASYQQVRRPIYASSNNRWKNYDAFIGPLKRALNMDGNEH